VAEDLGEKTEQPTARKLSDARDKGQVAKSQDLAAAVMLLAAVVIFVAFGSTLMTTLGGVMRRLLEDDTLGNPTHATSIPAAITWVSMKSVYLLVPLMLLMAVVAYLSQVTQVGLLFTMSPIKPKLDKINPISGAKKLFSKRNLVKAIVNFGKLIVALVVAVLVCSRHIEAVTSLPRLEVAPALYKIALICLELAIWLLLVLLLLAVVDLIYQRWQHIQDLKMTKQETKDERRSVEGDPEVKKRRMRMAQEIALQRIQSAVPDADVVVTNPTHVSVAIKYDAATMRAPRLVAKGADFLALRIRTVARECGVHIVERPPLARALYAAVDVGSEISPEHYEAVAEILAYVYRLEGRAA
jgi:flagellar biosynthetic protein FlhB